MLYSTVYYYIIRISPKLFLRAMWLGAATFREYWITFVRIIGSAARSQVVLRRDAKRKIKMRRVVRDEHGSWIMRRENRADQKPALKPAW